MLVSEPAVGRVIDDVKLRAEDFYLDRHRAIFGVMIDLYARGTACDELTVKEALDAAGLTDQAGGPNYVSELASSVPAPGNARNYAEIVHENALLRRLLETSFQIGTWVTERDGTGHEPMHQSRPHASPLHGLRSRSTLAAAACPAFASSARR